MATTEEQLNEHLARINALENKQAVDHAWLTDTREVAETSEERVGDLANKVNKEITSVENKQAADREWLSQLADSAEKRLAALEAKAEPVRWDEYFAKAKVAVRNALPWAGWLGMILILAVLIFKSLPGPGPGPNPVPPKPIPTPVVPAPIPVDGFRVLIVYETSDKMTAEFQAIILGKEVRDYLAAKCVKGPDGKTPEFRIMDKDSVVKDESKLWQDAMLRPRQSVPWLLVSNGRTGFEGPLPATVADTLIILRKHGG